MRNLSRTRVVMDAIRIIWDDHPDLRLGQLIANAVPEHVIYYIEEDQLIKALANTYGYSVEQLVSEIERVQPYPSKDKKTVE